MRYFPYSLAAIAALLCVPTLRAETALDIMLRDGTLRHVALADGMTFSLSGTTLTATSESSSISIAFDDILRMVYALDSHASLAAPTQQSISVECHAASLDIFAGGGPHACEVLDTYGRKVAAEQFVDRLSISTDGFASGVYIITIDGATVAKILLR